MGEHASGGADEVWAVGGLSGQADDDDRRVDEGNLRRYCWPTAQRRARQAEDTEEAEDAGKEALEAARLPSSSALRVGGKQERFVCRLGFLGMTATAPERGVDPRNQAQPPVAGI